MAFENARAFADKVSETLKRVGYVPPVAAPDWRPQEPVRPDEYVKVGTEPPASGLGDWDYKNADKVGPRGQELPRGALGWTPFGAPYYGGDNALHDWALGVQSRLTRPAIDPNKELAADTFQRVTDAWYGRGEFESASIWQRGIQAAFGTLGAVASSFEETAQAIENKQPGDEAGVLQTASRVVGEGIDATLAALQTPEEYFKRARGAVRGAAEVGGLDLTLDPTVVDWSGVWGGEFLRNVLFSVNVNQMFTEAFYAGKALGEGAVTGDDEASRALREGWDAGRILYSTSANGALKAEYVRRLQAGENAYLLAQELEDPILEMAGGLLADPLNFGIGELGKAGRLRGWMNTAVSEVADYATDGLKAFDKLPPVGNTVEASNMASSLIDEVMNAGQKIRNTFQPHQRLITFDKGRLMGLATQTSRRMETSQRAGSLWAAIAAQAGRAVNKADYAIDVVTALSRLHSDDAADVARAIDVLKNSGLPMNTLLSRTGYELGYLVREMMGSSGKFLDEISEASSRGIEAMMETYGGRVDKAVENMYPPISSVKDLTAQGYVINAADKLTSTKFYQANRKLFGSLYMGYNPGFVIRSAMTDAVHMFADLGVEGLASGGKAINPWGGVARREIEAAFGFVPKIADEGFSAAEDLSTGLTRLTGQNQANISLVMFNHGAKKVLNQGYDALIDASFDSLQRAGFSPDEIRLLRRELGITHDAEKASQVLRQAITDGYVDSSEALMFLDDARYGMLEAYGDAAEYRKALEAVRASGGDVEAAIKAHDVWFDSIEDFAKSSARVPPAVNNEVGQIMSGGMERGYVAGSTAQLANIQRNAGQLAEEAANTLIEQARRVSARLGIDFDATMARAVEYTNIAAPVGDDVLRAVADGQYIPAALGEYRKRWHPAFEQFRAFLSGSENAADAWKRLIGTEPPAGVTRDMLARYWYEGHYFPKVRQYWHEVRRTMDTAVQQIVQKAQAADPRIIQPADLRNMRRAMQESYLWDVSGYARNGLGVPGSQMSEISRLAILNGIPTATSTGRPTRHLLNIIRRHAPDGKYTDLAKVPFDVAEEAIRKWVADKGKQFNGIPEGVRLVNLPAGAPTELIPQRALQDFSITPSTAWANQIGGIRQLRAEVGDALRKAWGQPLAVEGSDVNKLAGLDEFVKVGNSRMAEIKLVAGRVGKSFRDFTVLPYSTGRTTLDTLLGVIYPYHFWHSRTYINWAKRIASNPGLIAGYGRYREMMAKEHAGLPEWWKYNVRSDELLGLFPENPLFFNLEGQLNPLNGLIAQDFNDPQRRVTWYSRMVDDLGKLGPSPWTFLQVAVAIALKQQGEEEAASRFGRGLIPQQGVLRAGQSLLEGTTGTDFSFLDPFSTDIGSTLFGDGIDPYIRDAAPRALMAMVNEGIQVDGTTVTLDVAIDAAASRSGPVWDAAVARVYGERAPGQLASYFLGVAFRARSIHDMETDQMMNQYNYLFSMRDNMPADQWRQEMDKLRQKFPSMDAYMISKKTSDQRDTQLSYNVLTRVPPRDSSLLRTVGLTQELVSKFYDSKGDWSGWESGERDRFMAGINDLRAMLATPSDATRQEWNAVRGMFSDMYERQRQLFGQQALDDIDAFYAALADNSDAKPSLLAQQAMDWRDRQIAANPLMATYDGGLSAISKYYNGLKWADVEAQLGADFFARMQANLISKAERDKYYSILNKWDETIERNTVRIAEYLPERAPATLRPDAQPQSSTQQAIAAAVQPAVLDERGLVDALGENGYEIVLDFLQTGRPMHYQTRNKLIAYAESIGMNYLEILSMLNESLR